MKIKIDYSNGKGDNTVSDSENSSRIPRRQILAGVGATALSSPFVGSAAADKSDKEKGKEVLQRANKIRQNDGKQAWKNFLQAKGFTISSEKAGINLSKGSTQGGGGVSPAGFDNVDGSSSSCDICIDFSLIGSRFGIYTVEMSWHYDSEKWIGDGGYSPYDSLGLYFDPQMWDYEDIHLYETTYTSDKGVVKVEDDSVNDGLPFTVNDSYADDDTEYWAGLQIVPVGDYSSRQRYVYGEYLHSWNDDYTTYDLSVSYPGGLEMTFDSGSSVKTATTGTEGDGNTMMMRTQSDVSDPRRP